MLFARIVLLVQVVVMGGVGLAYWLRPYEMANLNGMLLMESVSVSNTRVYYGGLQLGLALFLLWSTRRPERLRSALVLLITMQAALVLARLGSLWLDGGTLRNLDLGALAYKVGSALLALLALYRLKPAPAAEPPVPLPPAELPRGEFDDDFGRLQRRQEPTLDRPDQARQD
ncbi:DUF4345 family protein [Azotobacter chroococcum]|uniref:DUF4345 domain-containing protein n=1 Tax=Azotobacter chroococcum NCIMB 8003 TaxID=1328314 RepID=A0A0C4WQ00_9GAMM|nr:DUF4345 family protein [Azotobacter chroococcum]AJE22746.1 Hypothetical protein Achr_33390 [Azotobacter chroococcum NCIMB 8003]